MIAVHTYGEALRMFETGKVRALRLTTLRSAVDFGVVFKMGSIKGGADVGLERDHHLIVAWLNLRGVSASSSKAGELDMK